MAKRGYRGKHPHNDMKVSNPSSGKYSAKLTKEYNKLGSKQKYPYIQSNYFYPQATMTISGTGDLVAASRITMSATTGETLMIKGRDGSTQGANNLFKANGTNAQATNGIVELVNAGLAGKITASNVGDTVVLTQEEPGPDGHTTITTSTTNINNTVTFNSVAANNSGSGFAFTGG